jgi:antitoxin component of MazEF toxin-antitoxin module
METLDITKLVRVGTSYGVIIPVHILRALHIERGDHVVFAVGHDDVICMRKVSDDTVLQIKQSIINI